MVMEPSASNIVRNFSVKCKRGENSNLDKKKALKKLKGIGRLEMLIKLKDDVPAASNDPTEGARNFVNCTLCQVLKCLRNHINDDKAMFLQKWNIDGGLSILRSNGVLDGENTASIILFLFVVVSIIVVLINY